MSASPAAPHAWLEAARPKTLPAAVAPVLVGTAVASTLIWWRFLAALVVALALQVAVNYANDLFDGLKGVDTDDRLGPRRAVASGLVSATSMKRAMIVALAVAAVAGLALTIVVGWELLLVGLLSMLAALGYSGGDKPYASRALGEVSVFLFFGVIATVGSQYVQDEAWSTAALVASLPVGAIATAILVVNNLRDIPTDEPAGKRTLAVVLGDARTRTLFRVLVIGALVVDVAAVTTAVDSGWALLGLVGAPLAFRASTVVGAGAHGKGLIRALELTGRLHLVHGIGLAIGLAIATSGTAGITGASP